MGGVDGSGVGFLVGADVGDFVGSGVIGTSVGGIVGFGVGFNVGLNVGGYVGRWVMCRLSSVADVAATKIRHPKRRKAFVPEDEVNIVCRKKENRLGTN